MNFERKKQTDRQETKKEKGFPDWKEFTFHCLLYLYEKTQYYKNVNSSHLSCKFNEIPKSQQILFR